MADGEGHTGDGGKERTKKTQCSKTTQSPDYHRQPHKRASLPAKLGQDPPKSTTSRRSLLSNATYRVQTRDSSEGIIPQYSFHGDRRRSEHAEDDQGKMAGAAEGERHTDDNVRGTAKMLQCSNTTQSPDYCRQPHKQRTGASLPSRHGQGFTVPSRSRTSKRSVFNTVTYRVHARDKKEGNISQYNFHGDLPITESRRSEPRDYGKELSVPSRSAISKRPKCSTVPYRVQGRDSMKSNIQQYNFHGDRPDTESRRSLDPTDDDKGCAVPSMANLAVSNTPTGPVQVIGSTGVHLGNVSHYHFHGDQTKTGRRRSLELRAEDKDALEHTSGYLALRIQGLRGKSELYRAHCLEKVQRSFVETAPYNSAKKMISEKNSVLLVGGSGEGKSSVLYHLSANPPTGYLPIPCNNPNDIRRYIDLVEGTGIRLLFTIDDPFGCSYIQQRLVDEWVNVGKSLEMYLTVHKFMFATRKTVWAHCESHLLQSPFFCNVVEVTSANLTPTDKRRLLQIYSAEAGKLTDEDVKYIVNNDKPIAYCQCCKLMGDAVRKGQTGKELVTIFERPYSFLGSELKKMAETEQMKYATLCLIMLCGGVMKCKELAGTLSDIASDVRERINVCGLANSALADIQECAEKLVGTYLDKVVETDEPQTWKIYKFSHDSIYESLIMRYGKRHLPHCLKFLQHDILVEIVRPHDYDKREQEFVLSVPTLYYSHVAQLFTDKAIVDNWALEDVFQNPCVTDEQFLLAWCQYLKSAPHKLTAFGDAEPWFGYCVLYYAALSGASTLLKFLMDDHSLSCRCEGILASPLCGAVYGEQTEIVTYLMTSHKPTEKESCLAVELACEIGNISVLTILLKDLRGNQCTIIEKGVDSACYSGSYETVEYLLERFYSPCRRHECICGEKLIQTASDGFTDVVRVLLSHGADIKTTDQRGNTGLHRAARQGHTDTVCYIVGQGAQVSAGNKYGVSALHQAAYGLHPGSASVLLENGATVNMTDRWGQTPLVATLTTTYDHIRCRDIVHNLLHHGANPNITDKWNRSPREIAKRSNGADMVKAFAEYVQDPNTIGDLRCSEPSESDQRSIDEAYLAP